LKAQSTGGGIARQTTRVRRTIVVAQVALAFVLTVGAGLMTRSLHQMLATNPATPMMKS
jgi:hypothetical protein